ncbi:hypothetical protein P280DRAFT_240167 [Massarina eburnea CBS 473.64]|uniref:Uncharacterized protein n=1 Tax=Massarina eburnea CBS 473.64 TaxID=1395130 RepID=A0A6A6S4S4_9PLEO|nr:hypothetical protein P280DRAFT_240167 [Massarina eburnea CBS 473.64]
MVRRPNSLKSAEFRRNRTKRVILPRSHGKPCSCMVQLFLSPCLPWESCRRWTGQPIPDRPSSSPRVHGTSSLSLLFSTQYVYIHGG